MAHRLSRHIAPFLAVVGLAICAASLWLLPTPSPKMERVASSMRRQSEKDPQAAVAFKEALRSSPVRIADAQREEAILEGTFSAGIILVIAAGALVVLRYRREAREKKNA